jgi:hypothetical protein
LKLLRLGASSGKTPLLKSLGILFFSFGCLIQSLATIMHPLSFPGKTGGVESSALAGVNK